MSLFTNSNVTCPNCGAVVNMPAVGSVNADRRPDLRAAILDDTFQMTSCPTCQESFRLAPAFNYLDVGHGQWLAGMPAGGVADWPGAEDEARAVFAAAYGPTVPAAARAVAEGMQVRLCFGWPAIREKIWLKEAGLDDVVIEMMKLDIMRRLKDAPFVAGVEMRVVAEEGPVLRVVWVEADTEAVVQSFGVQRAMYDAILAKPGPWAPVQAQLTDGPFVDMQKLFVGEGRAAAPAA